MYLKPGICRVPVSLHHHQEHVQEDHDSQKGVVVVGGQQLEEESPEKKKHGQEQGLERLAKLLYAHVDS